MTLLMIDSEVKLKEILDNVVDENKKKYCILYDLIHTCGYKKTVSKVSYTLEISKSSRWKTYLDSIVTDATEIQNCIRRVKDTFQNLQWDLLTIRKWQLKFGKQKA